jgi:hypothetical protein
MMFYYVSIACVDGETEWSMRATAKIRILKFLDEYDHEGASISLNVEEYLPNGTYFSIAILYGEDVYHTLREKN